MTYAVIGQPVIDLLSEPSLLTLQDYSHEDLRQTQLLFGDKVSLIEEKEEWLYVEAPSQLCFRENEGWHGYRGWIPRNAILESSLNLAPTHVITDKLLNINGMTLSYGTLLTLDGTRIILPTKKHIDRPIHGLRLLPQSFQPNKLAEDAALFLGDPYLWGGTAAFGSGFPASLDCSGLTYLLFRAQGILIPRDAHDQWLKATPIETSELRTGDLLFLAREDRPHRITHVLLYLEEGKFIEAPQTNEVVRLVSIPTVSMKGEEALIQIPGREKRYYPHFRRFL